MRCSQQGLLGARRRPEGEAHAFSCVHQCSVRVSTATTSSSQDTSAWEHAAALWAQHHSLLRLLAQQQQQQH
jgi:hypothetical protein